MKALGNVLGAILILAGITFLFWQPGETELGALFGNTLTPVLVGLGLIGHARCWPAEQPGFARLHRRKRQGCGDSGTQSG